MLTGVLDPCSICTTIGRCPECAPDNFLGCPLVSEMGNVSFVSVVGDVPSVHPKMS